MIRYNPKDWFSLIFRFHKSDTFRILFPSMIFVGIYSAGIAFVASQLKIQIINGTALHTLLGFVLSLLLVFRTNTAYERWWEGRKLWGAMVNNTRNLAAKLNSLLSKEDQIKRETFAVLISNYAISLKDHLREEASYEKLDSTEEFNPEDLKEYRHLPNAITTRILEEIQKLRKANIISAEDVLFLNEELRSFNEITGACERIRSTPIPYSYSLFLKKFLFVYIMTLPLGFVSIFNYWIIPIVLFVFYVLLSLELIAEEIEDPFGKDSNDLPTDEIALRIRMNTREILGV